MQRTFVDATMTIFSDKKYYTPKRAAMWALIATCLACGCNSVHAEGGDNRSYEFANIINPRIPDAMYICGQKVDLQNVDYYERLDRELTSLAYTHGTTLLILKRANRYFPQIAPILRSNGVPDDLLYLACVESSLDTRAYSPAKAAGIWQFIPATAKEYGLEISDEVDERLNIEKATAAACRYFKKALARYNGDWLSVFASYNTGMARVSKELDAQDTTSAAELWLSKETMRYPFRIIAIKAILESPADYGFVITADQLYQPREVKVVEINGPVESWVDWAAQYGISYRELRDENPWIQAKQLTNRAGKTYRVRVPLRESLKRSSERVSVYNQAWIGK